MNRRQALALAAASWAASRTARAADQGLDGHDTAEAAQPLAMGAAWRGPRPTDPQHVGVIELDFARRRSAIRWSQVLPSRAHGLLAQADGVLLAVAMRPGSWLLQCDRDGRPMRRLDLDNEPDRHRLDGHAVASADGRWLFTTQTDATGRGWVAVRDAVTLRTQDRWPTHGVDPHQLLRHPQGDLMVANGGLLRHADGRKRDLDRMASSLVRLDGRSGALRGRWALDDPRLSLRHLAWNRPTGAEPPLLGVALQAEHDERALRERAPVLALWDGDALRVAAASTAAGGYAGDIAPVAPGGLALSNHALRKAFAWWAAQADTLPHFVEADEPYALASTHDGPDADAVLVACAAGAARWHPTQPPAMLRWPQPMALDNHWIVLDT
jgi:uncharacterized protein